MIEVMMITMLLASAGSMVMCKCIIFVFGIEPSLYAQLRLCLLLSVLSLVCICIHVHVHIYVCMCLCAYRANLSCYMYRCNFS